MSVCSSCDGSGYVWRVPDSFNPFYAGGFNTARAMFKVPCIECRHGAKRPQSDDTAPTGSAK